MSPNSNLLIYQRHMLINPNYLFLKKWLVTVGGFWLVIVFIGLLQLVTTSKDYSVTVLHTSQINVRHARFSQSVTIFTSRCSVAASNGGRSPSSGFSNCPRKASHSNSSQQLKPNGYLTNCNSLLVLLITSQHGQCRKQLSSVTVQLLYSDGVTYSNVACAAIGTDSVEKNFRPLQCSCHIAMAWLIPMLPAQPSARTAQKTLFLFFFKSAAW
jgi:hypothetical protein